MSWRGISLHCDIHRLLKAATENEEMTLADVTDKVTQVLADLIAAFPVGIRSQHLGYTLGCLVQSIVEHGEPVLDSRPVGNERFRWWSVC
jgi:hypothetical protein